MLLLNQGGCQCKSVLTSTRPHLCGYDVIYVVLLQLRKTYQELMLDTMTKLANTSKTDPVVTRQIREIFEFEKLLAKVITNYLRC